MNESAPQLSPRLKSLLDDATSEAKHAGHDTVTASHVVLVIRERYPEIAQGVFDEETDRHVSVNLAAQPKTFGYPQLSEQLLTAAVNCLGQSDEVGAMAEAVRAQVLLGYEPPGDGAANEGSGRKKDSQPAQHDSGRRTVDDAPSAAGQIGGLALSPRLAEACDVYIDQEPLVLRTNVCERVAALLSARQPQVPLLVTATGEGRSTLAQCLAFFLSSSDNRGALSGLPVVRVRAEPVLADRRYDLIRMFADEVRGKGILFIDDLEAVAALGWNTVIDPGPLQTIRGLMADPNLPVSLSIGAEYVDRLQARDAELFDKLERIDVPPMTPDEVLAVAKSVAKEIARHHGAQIPSQVIARAVAPARQIDIHKHPALAIHRMDRAAAAAAVAGRKRVRVEDLGSDVTGQQYLSFHAERARIRLHEKVRGQGDAVRQITDLLSVSKLSLDARPERPDGVFLFAGPTGTGKTALALAMAEELFGSDQALIRLDMSEYHDQWSISKLIGPPPGYVGSDEPESWLTTKIRKRPQSVLLLDEIEKADPRVWNTFLQVFDAGVLTDSRGRLADFRDVVVVLTTNIGAEIFTNNGNTGFTETVENSSADDAAVRRELKQRMRPELLNRLDGILVFQPLTRDAIQAIADDRLNEALERYRQHGWDITCTPDVLELLVSRGYDKEYGARPMLRTIDQLVGGPVSRLDTGRYTARVEEHALVFRSED